MTILSKCEIYTPIILQNLPEIAHWVESRVLSSAFSKLKQLKQYLLFGENNAIEIQPSVPTCVAGRLGYVGSDYVYKFKIKLSGLSGNTRLS